MYIMVMVVGTYYFQTYNDLYDDHRHDVSITFPEIFSVLLYAHQLLEMILFVSLSLLIISRTYHTTVRMILIKKRTTARLRFDLCLLEYFGVVRLYKPLVRAQYTRIKIY